jgi:hypothetical protein
MTRCDGRDMHTITCRHCQIDVLVDNDSTVSMHRTSDGTIGYVRCPLGHLSVVHFDTRRAVYAAAHRREPEPCTSC